MPTSTKMGSPGGRSWQEGLPGGGELAVWEDLDGEKVGQRPGSGKSGKRCPGRVEGKGSYDGSGEKHLPRSQWCKHSESVCVCTPVCTDTHLLPVFYFHRFPSLLPRALGLSSGPYPQPHLTPGFPTTGQDPGKCTAPHPSLSQPHCSPRVCCHPLSDLQALGPPHPPVATRMPQPPVDCWGLPVAPALLSA